VRALVIVGAGISFDPLKLAGLLEGIPLGQMNSYPTEGVAVVDCASSIKWDWSDITPVLLGPCAYGAGHEVFGISKAADMEYETAQYITEQTGPSPEDSGEGGLTS